MEELSLLISVFLTWGIGLGVPYIIRFKIKKTELSKLQALFVIGIIFFLQFSLSFLMGNNGKHYALMLVSVISYSMLTKK